MKYFLFILVFVLSQSVIYSQGFDKQKMDSFIRYIQVNDKAMFSMAFSKNGEPFLKKQIGYAVIDSGVKANENTKYRIGSISKVFTSVIVLKLINLNYLTLETNLHDYFPQIKNSENITIEMLLRHRSGIPNITQGDYLLWNTKSISQDELLKKIVNLNSNFKPNSKYEYSNSNYILLTLIIEKLAKRPYNELLQDDICIPCGLLNTYVGGKINPNNNEAYSYIKDSTWELSPETDMSVPLGAGNLVSNPLDLNKFFNCLFTYKLLSRAMTQKMIEFQDGYGLGMIQFPFNDKIAYGHTGGIDGFSALSMYFPENKVSYSICSNGTSMNLMDINNGILSIYFNQPYDFPVFKKQQPTNLSELKSIEGIYSSPELPIKINFFIKDNQLYGQGTDQPEFPLIFVGNQTYIMNNIDFEVVFEPQTQHATFTQAGIKYYLTREKADLK